MTHFRATIKGQRGEASRLGSKSQGMVVTVRGWRAGLTITARYDEATGEDVFEIALDGGSGSAKRAPIVLDGTIDATVRAKA
jgi:hypothetical protein